MRTDMIMLTPMMTAMADMVPGQSRRVAVSLSHERAFHGRDVHALHRSSFGHAMSTSHTPSFRANNELALHVSDPEAAAAFYERALGCRIANRTEGWIEVASGALRLYFVRDPSPTHDRVIPSFDVEDREAAVRHLQVAGCTLVPVGPHSPRRVLPARPVGRGVRRDPARRRGLIRRRRGMRFALSERTRRRVAPSTTPASNPCRT
jgi:catechol 2,3-dioxygenase-like lactoylglutathione lyase family enzyme